MRIILSMLALVMLVAPASAQYWYPSHGYAWYPSYYGGGYYRGGYYGGGLPYRGYNGYHMAERSMDRAPAYRPPLVRYNWYGGNSRAYLGGRGGGWGGEW